MPTPIEQAVVWITGAGSGSLLWGNKSYWYLGSDPNNSSESITTLGAGYDYPNNDSNYIFDVYIPSGTVTKDNTGGTKNSSAANITVNSLNIGTGGGLVVDQSGAQNGGGPNTVTVNGVTQLDGSLTVKTGGSFDAVGDITGGDGAIVVNGGGFNAGGNIDAFSFAVRGGSNVTLNTPTATYTLSQNLAITNESTLTIGAETFSALAVNLESGGELILDGTNLQLSGNLEIGSGGAEVMGAGTISGPQIVGAGYLVATGNLTVDAQIADTVKIQIWGGGDLILGASSTVGSIGFDPGSMLTVDGVALTIDDREFVGGSIALDDNAILTDNSGIDLDSGGSLTGSGTVVTGASGLNELNGGVVTASGGTLEFRDSVDASDDTAFNIADGATLKFDAGVGSHGLTTVTFQGPNGTLDLTGEGAGFNAETDVNQFNAMVQDFTGNDEILVKGQAGDTVVYDNQTGLLEVENSAHGIVDEIQFAPGDDPSQVYYHYDATTGDLVITANSSGGIGSTPCFLAGTLVRTPEGDAAVETLKAGDLVVTHDGRSVPVSWLGKQTISMRFADPLRVLPIRVKAGALADNVPARDLLISPDHAVLIGGALVQAGALVNGTSIVREVRVPVTFVYYHVETDDHSLILAEGAPAETFVDTVDRLNFDNWAEHQALYPEGKTVEPLPYPRAKSHRQVPVHIRVRLAERAHAFAETMATVA